MKKWMEAPLIVAVAVSTILGTAAALQGLPEQASPVDTWLLKHITNWWKSAQGGVETETPGTSSTAIQAQRAEGAPATDVQRDTSGNALSADSLQASATEGNPLSGGWSAADTAELQQVVHDLQTDLTTSDWQQIVRWLEGNPDEAAQQIPDFLQAHIPAADWAWVQTKLPDTATWVRDIRLLQQAGAQWWEVLTPEERQWLLQQGSTWLGNNGATAGGL